MIFRSDRQPEVLALHKTASGYAVSNSEKLAEHDYTGTNTAVLVKINIRRNSLTVAKIYIVQDRP